MRLEGKVALISGGARGMGAAEAKLFSSEGARVILGDILEEQGQELQAEIAESGGEAVFVKLDVTIESDWRQAVEQRSNGLASWISWSTMPGYSIGPLYRLRLSKAGTVS